MIPLSRKLLISFAPLLLLSCGGVSRGGSDSDDDTPRDTLHAVTLYGPTSYFNYRGQEMGFEYENLKRFAEDNDMELALEIAPSMQSLMKMLAEGKAELAAYPVPRIGEYMNEVRYCGPNEVTWQVLVQPGGSGRISDVTQLVGKTVYVEKDSKYEFRLRNLNDELGGGIDIRAIHKDTLATEDLIGMVNSGEIPLTVVDSDIAELNKSYFPHLDVGMKIGLEQFSSWAVGEQCDSLAAKLERWNRRKESSALMREIYKKYFEISKSSPEYEKDAFMRDYKPQKNGDVSPYDAIFKRIGKEYGLDWRFLASIAYNESRFNNDIVSWAGAVGIMQLMPVTAKAMGVAVSSLRNPENNITAAARLISHLDKTLSERIPDSGERLKFIAAAYNGGLGHISDAIALAEKYGLNPQEWLGNVGEAVVMKSRPQYYNDPVVRNGYFRGSETIDFVDRVMETYSVFNGLNKS